VQSLICGYVKQVDFEVWTVLLLVLADQRNCCCGQQAQSDLVNVLPTGTEIVQTLSLAALAMHIQVSLVNYDFQRRATQHARVSSSSS